MTKACAMRSSGRRTDESGVAARHEVALLPALAEAQARVVQGMEQVRHMGDKLVAAHAMVAKLNADMI